MPMRDQFAAANLFVPIPYVVCLSDVRLSNGSIVSKLRMDISSHFLTV